MKVRSVILCGGSGTRLWPLSRSNYPKQFIPLIDGKSLFELTVLRSLKVSTVPVPIIITSKNFYYIVKRLLQKLNVKSLILIEPEKKNTTTAIYLAAKAAKKSEKLLIMPSDHLIPDVNYFAGLIKELEVDENYWVTFGIKPTSPSEAYGYIDAKTEKNLDNDCFYVNKFIEKPNNKEALRMVKDGTYYWNSGIFIAKKEVVIGSINTFANDIAISCENLWDNINYDHTNNEIYFDEIEFKKIREVSIDYSVMERSDNIIMKSFNSIWSDVGSWDSFAGNFSDNKKDLLSIDSKNNFILSENKTVATVGLKNTIVVDTEDCLLILKKGQSDKIKDILQKVKLKKENILENRVYEERPWGTFKIIANEKGYKVKLLSVYPFHRLSYQYHNHRSEHWYIIKGNASVNINNEIKTLCENESIFIPSGAHHFVENKIDDELLILEIQLGSHLEESDIIRLDDPYNRSTNVNQ